MASTPLPTPSTCPTDSTKLEFELRKARGEVERLKFQLKRMRQELRRERAERRRLHGLLNDSPQASEGLDVPKVVVYRWSIVDK